MEVGHNGAAAVAIANGEDELKSCLFQSDFFGSTFLPTTTEQSLLSAHILNVCFYVFVSMKSVYGSGNSGTPRSTNKLIAHMQISGQSKGGGGTQQTHDVSLYRNGSATFRARISLKALVRHKEWTNKTEWDQSSQISEGYVN